MRLVLVYNLRANFGPLRVHAQKNRLTSSVHRHCKLGSKTTRNAPPQSSEVECLVEAYVKDNGFVNYRGFCDEVEKVFTTAGLQVQPLEAVEWNIV